MHRTFGAVFATLAVVAMAPRLTAQMVSTKDARAQYDSTADLPDTLSPGADVDAVAGKYKPTVKADEFDKSRTTIVDLGDWFRGPGNRRIKSKCTGGGIVANVDELKVAKIERAGAAEPLYGVYVSYGGSTWIFTGAKPFQTLVDGQLLELQPSGDVSREASGGFVSEDQTYRAMAADLRRLADAHALRSRIQGKQGDCSFDWRPGSIAALRQFVAHELPAQ